MSEHDRNNIDVEMDMDDDSDELDDIDELDELEDEDDDAPATAQAAGSAAGTSTAADELADFVRHVLSNLVDQHDQLQVIPEQRGSSVHIRVLVPEDELGRVIGRQGRIARSMRTLLTIAAARRSLRASLDIDAAPVA